MRGVDRENKRKGEVAGERKGVPLFLAPRGALFDFTEYGDVCGTNQLRESVRLV